MNQSLRKWRHKVRWISFLFWSKSIQKERLKAICLSPTIFPREKMPFHLAPRFRKPILIIAGDKDDRTPLWMSGKIYDALPENIDKKLSVYAEAGHGGPDAPYFVDMERWMEETVEFMDHSL